MAREEGEGMIAPLLDPRQPVEMVERRALFADILDGKSGSLDVVMYYSSIALLTISSCN